MPKYERVKGGEKNENSGKRWTSSELKEVLDLYFIIDGLGIHENNPQIHQLSIKLKRTIRSVEAQLLMFRNISRRGRYAWGHMSKKCIKVWEDHFTKGD